MSRTAVPKANDTSVDTLSRLAGLLEPKARMDIQCLLGQGWSIRHEAAARWTAPFHYVARGDVVVRIEGRTKAIPVRAGSLVVLPHGAAHVLAPPADNPAAAPLRSLPGPVVTIKTNLADRQDADAEILCGTFEFLSRRRSVLLDALPEVMVVETGERAADAALETLVRMISRELDQAQPGAHAIVGSLVGVLFTLALRAHLVAHPRLVGMLALLANARLEPGLAAMLAEPGSPWTIEQLAARCHMSRATLVREYRRAAGLSPLALLTALRMELAASMLVHEDHPTAGIGERVGYQSEAAFNRAFSKHVGLSPARFRRQARLDASHHREPEA